MTSTVLNDPQAAQGRPHAPDRARGRRTLLLLAFICVLPVVASYLAFYVWPPTARANYGALIGPTPLPDTALPPAAGQAPLGRADFDGRWTLLYAGPAACAENCREALHTLRQVRLAQGKDMARVGRVWLQTDATAAAAAPPPAADTDGLRIAVAAPGSADAWLAALPGAESGAHFYLVDPLGNVMMRFPPQADPRRVVKDLQRLLKYSALGR